MLSKATIKYINSLKQKKFRQRYHKFTAEGDKIVREIAENPNIEVEKILATEEWATENAKTLHNRMLEIVTPNELKKVSSLQTPNHALAIVEQFSTKIDEKVIRENLSLVLDSIQDPGNLGTIIRIADWFGIPYIFCSKGCVDVYNPKVIQSTMGSILRVRVIYTDLEELFSQFSELNIYGAVLGGHNIFQTKLAHKGFIVIGNESKGISKDTKARLTHHLEIPSYGQAESLNAAVATGIICAMFRK